MKKEWIADSRLFNIFPRFSFYKLKYEWNINLFSECGYKYHNVSMGELKKTLFCHFQNAISRIFPNSDKFCRPHSSLITYKLVDDVGIPQTYQIIINKYLIANLLRVRE